MPPVVTINIITPIVSVKEKDGVAEVCARKDVETARSVTSFITTSPGKALGMCALISCTSDLIHKSWGSQKYSGWTKY